MGQVFNCAENQNKGCKITGWGMIEREGGKREREREREREERQEKVISTMHDERLSQSMS